MPTASGITQARKRLGPAVLAEVFEQVAAPVADMLTRGAWLRRWRLVAIDGFEVDLPDTPGNAAEFGYAGSGDNRSAFPRRGWWRWPSAARTRSWPRRSARYCGRGEDPGQRGSTSGCALMSCSPRTATSTASTRGIWPPGSGAALLWRAPTGLGLPVVRVLPDGTYLSVLINPTIRGARRREAIMAAAEVAAREVADGQVTADQRRRDELDLAELDPAEAHLVRVVEYDVPDRAGNGTGELIVVLIHDPRPGQRPRRRTRRGLPRALGGRDQQRPAQDPSARAREDPSLEASRAGPPGDLGVAAGPPRAQRPDHPGRRGC